MTVAEVLDKLRNRAYVRPLWIMNSLNMTEERFNELFGHVDVVSNNGFVVMATSDVLPILESF